MVWQVHGTKVTFDSGEDGLHISGEGQQFPNMTSTVLTSLKASERPAIGAWTIYEASRASGAASLISLNVKTMKRLLKPETMVGLRKPISLIKYHEPRYPGDDPVIGFATFLPKNEFEDVWRLAMLLVSTDKFRYWINYGFLGFIPNRYDESLLQPEDIAHPERKPLAYPDWLEGAPYYSDDGFTFRVLERTEKP